MRFTRNSNPCGLPGSGLGAGVDDRVGAEVLFRSVRFTRGQHDVYQALPTEQQGRYFNNLRRYPLRFTRNITMYKYV